MAKRSNETLESLPELSEVIPDTRIVSELYDGIRMTKQDETRRLLAEAHLLRESEKRLKLVKAKLAENIREEGYEAVRDGIFCCVLRYQDGKESLDRSLLVENGVTPEQIMMSMKRGNPFTVVELSEMSE
jgi:hypothetical protein